MGSSKKPCVLKTIRGCQYSVADIAKVSQNTCVLGGTYLVRTQELKYKKWGRMAGQNQIRTALPRDLARTYQNVPVRTQNVQPTDRGHFCKKRLAPAGAILPHSVPFT